MGGRLAAREHVGDHHVERAGPQPLEHLPGIPDPDPDPAYRQPAPDQVDQRGVGIDGQLGRARPGGRDVPGQREGPRAQVQHAQPLPGRRGRVDYVPQPPDVLEVQVARVVQVDVRLRDAVDQQHPRGRPVGVPQQLGAALGAYAAIDRVLPRPLSHDNQYRRYDARTRRPAWLSSNPERKPLPDPDQPVQSAEAPAPAGPPSGAEPDFDELKRKFREALDRKRDNHASAEGAHDSSKVHGSHGPAVSRRSFRRKSGG